MRLANISYTRQEREALKMFQPHHQTCMEILNLLNFGSATMVNMQQAAMSDHDEGIVCAGVGDFGGAVFFQGRGRSIFFIPRASSLS